MKGNGISMDDQMRDLKQLIKFTYSWRWMKEMDWDNQMRGYLNNWPHPRTSWRQMKGMR